MNLSFLTLLKKQTPLKVLVICGPPGRALQRPGCVHHHAVQHEMLHALGFHHEQVRSDHNNHVIILEENINPEERVSVLVLWYNQAYLVWLWLWREILNSALNSADLGYFAGTSSPKTGADCQPSSQNQTPMSQ
ncbi:hypothetical protein AOLI_G00143240 [Acnodon oligacanthus]